jgi:hypothetical protein
MVNFAVEKTTPTIMNASAEELKSLVKETNKITPENTSIHMIEDLE